MLDVFSQRRSEIGSQVKALISVRGPRTAHQKLTLNSLLKEADDLEIGVADEHERRKSAAFSKWLREGKMLGSEDRKLLHEVSTRDMTEVGLGAGTATGAGVFVPIGFERSVVSAMKDYSPLLALANVVDVASGRNHAYPNDDDAATSFGELLGEGQQASVADRAGDSVEL